MHKFQVSTDIKASPERVFDFIAQPRNLPGVWPSLIEVSSVVTRPDGSSDYDWIYKMAGVQLKGHTTVDEADPGELLRTHTEGAIQSAFRWICRSEDGAGTRLTVEVEYTLPVPVVGKVVEAIIVRLNHREGETMLANIKDVLEHGAAGIAAGSPPARGGGAPLHR